LAGVAVVLAGGCAPQGREVVIEEGYRGRARFNPFLAGWRLLEGNGWAVEERHGLAELPEGDVVLVLAAQSDQGEGAADDLAAWIEGGGHLVYLLAGADRYQDDWARRSESERGRSERTAGDGAEGSPAASPDSVSGAREENSLKAEPGVEEEGEVAAYPVLDRLGFRVRPRTEFTRACSVGGRALALEMPPGVGVRGPREWRWQRDAGVVRSEERGPAGVLSVPVGEGRLTVIGDAKPWRNRFVGEQDHAELFWRIVTLHGEPEGAWFLSHTRISFFALLWEYGWMPLVALGVWIALWLWRSVRRFGPILPDPEPASRDFLGHLDQAGAFLWARAGSTSLAGPVRRRVAARIVRLVGPMAGGGFSEEQWALLSRASGLPVARLRWALEGPVPKRRRAFTDLMAALQTIESSCP
jgi:hypothetical protein